MWRGAPAPCTKFIVLLFVSEPPCTRAKLLLAFVELKFKMPLLMTAPTRLRFAPHADAITVIVWLAPMDPPTELSHWRTYCPPPPVSENAEFCRRIRTPDAAPPL